jgi:two-component system response regulator AtoC
MSYSVLVVDDEELTLRTLSRGLRQEGFDVFTAASGEDALKVFQDEKPDLTILDIVLPGIDGVEVLRQIKQNSPSAIVIMMSAYHLVDRAVEAMKLGAYDYLIKPFHLADVTTTLHRASEMLALRVRVRDTVESAKGRYDFGRVVTQNAATTRMLEMARKASEADHTTILIQGESGTGKGVLAKAIHYASPRAAMPLLELNCAALPDTLLESELFGARRVCWSAHRAARCFWMRSATCHPVCRPSCCAYWKTGRSCGWAARVRSRLMFAW